MTLQCEKHDFAVWGIWDCRVNCISLRGKRMQIALPTICFYRGWLMLLRGEKTEKDEISGIFRRKSRVLLKKRGMFQIVTPLIINELQNALFRAEGRWQRHKERKTETKVWFSAIYPEWPASHFFRVRQTGTQKQARKSCKSNAFAIAHSDFKKNCKQWKSNYSCQSL